MHLGVNVVRLTRRFTGVGRYIECVLAEWAEMPLPFDRVTLFAPVPLDPARVAFPLDRFEVVTGGPRAPDPIWEARFLNPRAKDLDVLFCPSYTVPFGYPGRCAVTNLGPSQNRPLTREWWRSMAYEQLYRISARRADHVSTCSGWVKQRVVEKYGVPAEKVSVVWLAPSRLFAPVRDPEVLRATRQRYAGAGHGDVDAPFTLFVGKLARRHSIPNLIQAFARARVRANAPRHKLVLAGPNYLHLDIAGLARAAGIEGAVIHHDFVEHRHLPALFSAAEESVFPATDAEGFGVPVIESMACGTPVVSVAQGSIPEFATGAALLVPSSSVEDLTGGIATVLADAGLRDKLASEGLRRAGQITWRFTAERLLRDLHAVATGVPAAGPAASVARPTS